MSLPEIDSTYLLDFLTGLLNTPSPTGFTQRAIAYIENSLQAYPALQCCHTRKGALIAVWPGASSDAPRALTAHTDTLGGMVKEIKADGRLLLTRIGGYAHNTVEGEACTVFTRRDGTIRGAYLLEKSSSHVYGAEVSELKRDENNMEVRLDARTQSEAETRALGIEVGDFVAFDPRIEVVNGFVRSRHLDDKASVACILAAVKALHDAGLQPVQKTYLHFSNYEEVGHGTAGIPSEITELLAIDMAAIGKGLASDEFHASLCVKDSGGPYHYEMNERLRRLAEQHAIPHKVDTYPYYNSDGTAFWRAGNDVAVALIGPGVDASHSYERTHLDALLATTQWVAAYLLS
jgi:putative aminopeptidase FrvX